MLLQKPRRELWSEDEKTRWVITALRTVNTQEATAIAADLERQLDTEAPAGSPPSGGVQAHGPKARKKMGKAQRLRRGAAIHAYVGANGAGKSLAMVHDTLPSLDRGRMVYSTVDLYDANGNPHPNFVKLRRWAQLLDLHKCDVLLDEVLGSLNNRKTQSLPVQVQQLIVQLRRRDIVLRWTSPSYAHGDVDVRRVTQAVTVCRGLAGKEHQEDDREWTQRRLFRWKTYDAIDWEEVTAGKLERAKPLAKQWFWRPGSRVENSYRTDDDVATLDHLTDAGTCTVCGGTRRRPQCKPGCPGHPGALALVLDDDE